MLGHVLYKILEESKKFDLFDISYRNKLNSNSIICDVTNSNDLEKIIFELKPDFIINCIGILLKNSKIDSSNTIYLNAFLPHKLKNISDKVGSRIIQISTDCVFDGIKGFYNENDTPNAIDLYGISKSLGELNNNRDLTIRTSIIGPELKQNGEGLLHWLFNQKGDIYGYKNVFWSGVTTLQLSRAIVFAIENEIDGLWNLTNGIKTSKYDLIENIINVFELNKINLIEDFEKISNKTLVSLKGIDYKVPSYNEMINELKIFYNEKRELYSYLI